MRHSHLATSVPINGKDGDVSLEEASVKPTPDGNSLASPNQLHKASILYEHHGMAICVVSCVQRVSPSPGLGWTYDA